MKKTIEISHDEAALLLSVEIEDAKSLTETALELLAPILDASEPNALDVAEVLRRRRMIDTALRTVRDLLEGLLWDALLAPDEDLPGGRLEFDDDQDDDEDL